MSKSEKTSMAVSTFLMSLREVERRKVSASTRRLWLQAYSGRALGGSLASAATTALRSKAAAEAKAATEATELLRRVAVEKARFRNNCRRVILKDEEEGKEEGMRIRPGKRRAVNAINKGAERCPRGDHAASFTERAVDAGCLE
eukprot:1172173-Prorocentrum_minimum.AAC.1